MTRILHISDLHACISAPAAATDREAILDALIEDVRALHRERPVDAVVMSGDLAFSGAPEQFDLARTGLLEPLEEALALDRTRIVIVPGNHDVDRAAIDLDREIGLQSRLDSREAAMELFGDASRLARATERMSAWHDFRDDFYSAAPLAVIPPLGHLHAFDTEDAHVRVAALDSAWRSSGDHDRGRLILGELQARAAVDALQDGDLRIFVFHHPTEWLVSWDADEVRHLLAGALVLNGHDHVPDPTLETTVRGTVLYSRGACLYESFEYWNGYSILDIDRQTSHTTVFLRDWYRERETFDEATRLSASGRLELDWPNIGQEVAVPTEVRFSQILSTLGDIVHQRSIISDYLSESRGIAGVDDILLPPRLWPVPYREAVAVAARGEGPKPERIDNRSLLTASSPVLVAGDPESGVTGALLWLLSHRFSVEESRLPVYLPFDQRFKEGRFERAILGELRRYGLSVDSWEAAPPLIIAIDDVAPAHTGAMNAFVRFLREHPQHSFILACHSPLHEHLSRDLRHAGIDVEVAHVGPFGRRELRTFVEMISGAASADLVQRVTAIVQSERLPRTPFVITALVAVILQNVELADVNESSLLDAYVSFLLGQGESFDPRGSAMDHRRREHLLSTFAKTLLDENRLSMPRLEFEEFVARHFRNRDWSDRISAGRIAEDLISRRVLHESHDGNVGFRHPAFRALFLGMAIVEDEELCDRLVADPLTNENAIRHATGLRRSDAQLLRKVAASTRSVMSDASLGFDSSMFDLMKARPGWTREHPDIEALVQRLEEPLPPPPEEEEIDEQVDEFHDSLDFYEAEPVADEHPVDIAWSVARSLARVLRNSELVDNVDLKADVLKTVIDDWCVFVVMAAAREDQDDFLKTGLEELIGDGRIDSDALARLFEIMLTFITVIAAQSLLGTLHLEGTIKRVADDREFMDNSGHALMTTMLYAATGNADWPDACARLFEAHSDHPIVAELARSYALAMYRFGDLSESTASRLESFLADIYTAGSPAAGQSLIARNQQRARAIEQLRRRRLLDRHGSESAVDTFDELLDSESASEEDEELAG
jgi:predicted MPP superfamily phosphohydrolase